MMSRAAGPVRSCSMSARWGALGCARQERRQVRAVARPCGDDGGHEPEQHEAHRAADAGAGHGVSSGPRVRRERSPSRSRISTVRIASRSPASVTSVMLRASAGIARGEAQAPVRQLAAEVDHEVALERGGIAGERGADALHERHDLRVGGELEHVLAVPALGGEHPVIEHQGLGLRGQRALLEPRGGVVEELPGGSEGGLEHRHLVHFGEAHVSVAARGQESHQLMEGRRGGRRQAARLAKLLRHASPASGSRKTRVLMERRRGPRPARSHRS